MSAIVMLLKVIAIILYGAFALFLVSFVRNHAQKSIYKWLTVIFVILLPTWDVVLGEIVYYIACRNFAKVAVYETAETEGIYYEGRHNYIYELSDTSRNEPLAERTCVGWIYEDFEKGYKYAESRITKKQGTPGSVQRIVPPTYYRCTPLPHDKERPQLQRMSCVVVDQPQSRYMVKEQSFRVATVRFNNLKIIDRKTGKLMAEDKGVTKEKVFPFFYWLFRGHGPASSIGYPGLQKDGFFAFENKVLLPKNK